MANVFIRTVILYLLIVALMRLTGKRQIGQLELTELVTAFMISELASYPISNNSIPLFYGVIPAVTLVCLEVFLSYISIKSRTFRKVIAGSALALVKNGKLDQAQMNRARITLEELISAMRMAGISHLSDVGYAFLESSGTISVLPKAASAPPTASDMSLNVPENGMEHVLIVDGKTDEKELNSLGLEKRWLERKLKENGYTSPQEVFFMGFDDGQKSIFDTQRAARRENKEWKQRRCVMKSVITAGILFLAVFVFLWVNFFVLNGIFDDTLDLFSTLPVSVEALEPSGRKRACGN